MNKFYLMIGVVVISVWSNSVMSFYEYSESLAVPGSGWVVVDESIPFSTEAKTFSEAVAMLKGVRPGLVVKFPSYQIDKTTHKMISVKMSAVTKESGTEKLIIIDNFEDSNDTLKASQSSS